MRAITSILLCALCCMQTVAQSVAENVYTFDNKYEIVTNDKFIDVHTDRNGTEVKPYELIGQTTFMANAKEYKLQVLQYKGWQNEGGDFRIIRLLHDGKKILEFVDEESWLGDPEFADTSIWEPGITMRSINTGGSPFSQVLKLIGEHATYTGHCIVYPLENEATALLFEGYPWMNQPPLLTIIVIKDGKAKVVYNRPWFVTGLYARKKNFKLYLEDDCCTPQVSATISTTSEGSMSFYFAPYEEDDLICLQPDIQPMFRGKGMEALKSYLHENVRYPDLARKQGIQGRVIVQFIVNREGDVCDAKVIKSVHQYLDKEALRVVNAMPYWEPGFKDGKKVSVQMTLPIIFRLQKDNAVKVNTTSTGNAVVIVSEAPLRMTTGDTFGIEPESNEQEKAIKMLSDFYSRYLFGRGVAHFQLDATKYCTPRFLSKLGEDYEKQLQEDYIISQEELGLEWWSSYNFINGYQDGPHDINEVMKVVHEHDNTYRIYFIENGYENHRLIDLVKLGDSLLIDDVYRLKFELIDNAYRPVRYYE